MFEKRKLKNCIRYYCYHQRYLNDLISTFNLNNYDYAFVGGFVRWVIDKNFDSSGPRDFDIVVDIPKEDLESLLLNIQKMLLEVLRFLHTQVILLQIKKLIFGL